MSLRRRIGAAAGVAVAVTVIAAAAIVYVAVRSSLRGEVDEALRERASGLRVIGPGPGGPGPLERPLGTEPPQDFTIPAPPPVRFGEAEGFVQRIAPDGSVDLPPGLDRGTTIPVTPEALAIARTGEGESLDDVDADGTHLRVLTRGAGERGAVQIARPLTEVDNVLEEVLIVLLMVGAGGVALAALLGAGVARTALRPIARFTSRTEQIAGAPDISERIDVEGNDELARLAHSFNTTLDALERAVEAQRQLVADASHELRTPIASLRANIQTLEQADRLPPEELAALRADVVAELDELTALVADVVELARGARAEVAAGDVRLDELVADLVARAQRRANGAVTFDAALEPTLVRGEPERIGRAISNLLDNARKWSPDGTTVDVRLAGGELTVRDRGAGFADEDLPHVFERFYRARAARGMSGSGLGLAIVRQAAEAHGGSAAAANAPDGGAVLTVSFGEPVDGSLDSAGRGG